MSKALRAILGFVLLAVCVCASFTACADGKDGGEAGTLPPAEEDVWQTEDAVFQPSPRSGSTVSLAGSVAEQYYFNYERGCSQEYAAKNTDQFHMRPLVLSWSEVENAESYTVKMSRSSKMTDPVYTADTDKTSEEVDSGYLFVASVYYWQITAHTDGDDIVSGVFRVSVAEAIRAVTIDGVTNTRDIGGTMTESGKRIKQGLVYRGAKLDDITEKGKKDIEKFGFVTDLDLRLPEEGRKNVLGLKDIQIAAAPYYVAGTTGIASRANWEDIAREVKVFADESNYPIYFHCSVGRDRTGTLAFLLEALLGVTEEDIFRSYEYSFLSSVGFDDDIPRFTDVAFPATVNYVYADIDKTLQENCEQFLIKTGVTADEIAKIRSILLG